MYVRRFLLAALQVFPRLSDPSGHVMTVQGQSDLILMDQQEVGSGSETFWR